MLSFNYKWANVKMSGVFTSPVHRPLGSWVYTHGAPSLVSAIKLDEMSFPGGTFLNTQCSWMLSEICTDIWFIVPYWTDHSQLIGVHGWPAFYFEWTREARGCLKSWPWRNDSFIDTGPKQFILCCCFGTYSWVRKSIVVSKSVYYVLRIFFFFFFFFFFFWLDSV